MRTVHHGLPEQLLTPQPVKPSYFAFLGRIAPEKRVDRAIRIAEHCGMPLKIAAKVDKVDREYFEEQIQPLIEVGAMSNTSARSTTREKSEFLSGAIALLVPIDWPEPFGLVMIEAMACGTPVIAFNRGSVPEVIDEGVTGFIVEDETGAIGAVDRLAPSVAREGSASASSSASRRAAWRRTIFRSIAADGAHRAASAAGFRRRAGFVALRTGSSALGRSRPGSRRARRNGGRRR